MTQVSWWRTSFGDAELRNLTEAYYNEHISLGPVTARFEEQFAGSLGISYAVATTSGSTAILMALMALGIKRGDEVIVPNRTWIATAHAVAMLGAKVTLVDVAPDVPIIDVTRIEEKITPRTKAIIPVHLGGRAVPMKAISDLAAKYGLRVIEDAAQALYSQNADGYLGTQSDAGCFSLSVAKLISTGQGGVVVTKSEETYERLKRIRTHGVSDVIDVTYSEVGFNFRITDLQSAIGLGQLQRGPERIGKLKRVYEKYQRGLAKVPFLRLIPVDIEAGEIPLYVEVMCPHRATLISYLAERGIQTRPFYPNLNYASYFEDHGQYPHAATFGSKGLFLPCGPDQPAENIDRVLQSLESYCCR